MSDTSPDPSPRDMAESAKAAAGYLKTLAHEGRLMILCHLGQGEMSVGALEETLGIRQAAVSQMLARLRDEDRIAFTYAANPNGSVADIAGVLSANRRVLGMMPHPERRVEAAHGGDDGAAMFRGLIDALVPA